MSENWNQNMRDVFIPVWVNCLDESMSPWLNRWTCPGFVFCPRKPKQHGNEYHTCGCGLSKIVYAAEMVEGRDQPPQLQKDAKKERTTNLLLRLTKALANTGKVVVMDSGFCVLKALIALSLSGVFASALIKKRRFWPTLVAGDAIDQHMEKKEVGEVDVISGSLEGNRYYIWVLKEPDYSMKIMSTWGTNKVPENQRESKRTWNNGKETAVFKYTLPFSLHFDIRHIVDDHNNMRHDTPAIEDVWVTERWQTRVFSFFLAVTEVNCFYAMRYFVWKNDPGFKGITFQHSRKKLANSLIHNDLDATKKDYWWSLRQSNGTLHEKMTAPAHAKLFLGKGKWDLSAKSKYQQYVCKGPRCKKQVRTYCICNPGHWLCDQCFCCHVLKVNKN